jgi:diguanylate cyclase (GGDEF)-like protein
MERSTTDTWITPIRADSASKKPHCLVHIYPTGVNIGQRYMLSDRPVVIGRGDDADVKIADHSVSRRHARVEATSKGAMVEDLGSTNGTFVNDQPIETLTFLKDGDYLRVGNCIYRFLSGGNIEAEYHEEIYRLTIIDALTQIHNRRYLLEFLERELARSTRHHRPLALILFDIDHFKKINDQIGHLAGDYALREIAAMIKTSIRVEDLFARYGGEEFALVLVETAKPGALDVAERIRRRIEQQKFTFDGTAFQATVSLGVAFTDGTDKIASKDLIQQADEKLYEAKRTGRNRVCG